jgi:hypothetical protein
MILAGRKIRAFGLLGRGVACIVHPALFPADVLFDTVVG